MQIDVNPNYTTRATTTFDVRVDGVVVAIFGTSTLAYEHQDALWDRRSISDKTMESLYTGKDA